MQLQALSSALALFALVTPGRAGQDTAFPFDVLDLDLTAGEIALAPRAADVHGLTRLDHVRVIGVPLPDGTWVDLDLSRIDVGARGFGFQVDGAPAPWLLDGLDLSVWQGAIAGRPDTEAMLAFSHAGCHGWIGRGDEVFHLIAEPCGGSAWNARLVAESTLNARGHALPAFCRSDELPTGSAARGAPAPGTPLGSGSGSGPLAVSIPLYQCKVAIETDYQLYQVFGQNLASEAAYVATLLTWIGYRYEEQVATVLTYPYVQFYTSSSDPWSTQENGGNSVDLLYEFQGAWAYNVPGGAQLGAFVSGDGLGGGVAWLPGLCNEPYNFSVSGNINGGVAFPVQPSSSNWDFMVVAHELGHNLGAIHTHSYCPAPADECAPSGYFGSCQSQQVCTSQGTIMSYCHLCSGGTANVTTYFHAWSAADMRSYVESSCLPLHVPSPASYCTAKVNSLGCLPAIGYAGHATLTGLDDFHVTATNVLNQKFGLMYFGNAPLSQPFQGGTKCVATPFQRTPMQASGGTVGAGDCSGTYDFYFAHAEMLARGLSAGDTVYCQYWTRDPQSPSTTGLTNGLQFTVGS